VPQNVADQHLLFGRLDGLYQFLALLQVFADRFLAQNVLVVGQAILQDGQMGVGISGDDDNVNFLTLEIGQVVSAPAEGTAATGGGLCRNRVLVHNCLDSDVLTVIDVQQVLHANMAAANHKNAIGFHSRYPFICIYFRGILTICYHILF
jgi:hypothetical protein